MRNFKELFTDVFHDESKLLINLLEEKSLSGKPVDMTAIFHGFTLDSFSKIAFGHDFGCIKNNGSPIPFPQAFDTIQNILGLRFSVLLMIHTYYSPFLLLVGSFLVYN